MNNFVKAILLSVFISLFASVLSANSEAIKSQETVDFANILKARQAIALFDYNSANNFYATGFKNNIDSRAFLEEYLFFLVSQQDFKKSLEISNLLVKYSPKHFLANLTITSAYIKNNNLQGAIAHLKSLKPEQNSITDVLLTLLLGIEYYKNNQSEEFKKISSKISDSMPSFYYYYISLVNLHVNNNIEAAKSNLDIVSTNYASIDAIVLYSKILYKENQAQAVDYFSNYLSDNFLSENLIHQYLKTPIDSSLSAIFSYILSNLSASMNNDIDSIILVSDSFLLNNISVMLDSKNSLAKISVASFYEQIGNYDLALQLYKSISLEKNSFYGRSIALNVINMMKSLNKNAEALQYIQSLLIIDKNNPSYLLEQGQIYYNNKDYKKSIASYTEALKSSEKMKSNLGVWLSYYLRGVSLDKNNNWNAAEKDLLSAYNINSSDPILVNYLAYSWVSRDKNLDKSLIMLKDVIENNEPNASILDSYAWALFKIKQYKEALSVALKAKELSPTDYIIIDHLADIMWQNGFYEKAKKEWLLALTLSPTDDIMNSLNNKLNHVLPPYLTDDVLSNIKLSYDDNFVDNVRNKNK